MFRNAFATRASSPARTVYRANTATAIVSLSSVPAIVSGPVWLAE